jgi:uncharacterized protein
MGGLLVLAGLIALVLWVFARLFRSRVRSQLRERGHTLPEELRRAATPARPAAAVAAVAVAAAAPAAQAAQVAQVAGAPAAGPGGLHFVLSYEVAPDFLERRARFRDEHLALAWRAAEAGELVLAGALEEGAGQALLLFRGSRQAATRFAQADPYVREGLVKAWRVWQWHTVAGEGAALPQRPRTGGAGAGPGAPMDPPGRVQ